MASWEEVQGLNGVAPFMYAQSDKERNHMLKLVKYTNERGGMRRYLCWMLLLLNPHYALDFVARLLNGC